MTKIMRFKPPTTVFTPFGPPMGYWQLSHATVAKLNTTILTRTSELTDWSDNLVGKVKQELAMPEEDVNAVLKDIQPLLAQYAQVSYGRTKGQPLPEGVRLGMSVRSAWFVRQYENEFNPMHIHTGCNLSCVGYLSLPKGIEKEWEEDYKDHHPCRGHIQFTHGNDSKFSTSTFMVKPEVRDFFLFPSDLWHTVYPFSTDGERRSFSMNLDFGEVTE